VSYSIATTSPFVFFDIPEDIMKQSWKQYWQSTSLYETILNSKCSRRMCTTPCRLSPVLAICRPFPASAAWGTHLTWHDDEKQTQGEVTGLQGQSSY
jgi:hypothetical protein